MKRERAEDKQQQQDHHHHHNLFSNLHHHHQFLHHSQPSPPPPHPHRPTMEQQHPLTSEEADSHSPTTKRNTTSSPSFLLPPPPPTSDGATIEVARRPRGRPPGSKNKPKPPVVITRDSPDQTSMSPYVLELPAGVDIIETAAKFCRRRNMGLCILNGNGVVTNVTLKQPSSTPGATVTFHGRFDLLSMSATILPSGGIAAGINGMFTISLAGPQGQVVGGHVVGPLVSATTVYLMAATFNNPSYHRLDNDQDLTAARDGGGHNNNQSPSAAVSGEDSGAPGGAESGGGVPMYSYQPLDVIWAPTARPPPPPPPY